MYRVAVIGGGFAGVYAIKELHRKKNVKVTLFEPRSRFVFTPLLHEVAAGVLHIPNITYAYTEIFSGHFRHVHAAVDEINLSTKKILADGTWHEFEYIIIATGAKTWLPKPLDVLELKTEEDALRIKKMVAKNIREYEKTKDSRLLHTVIVGGGATGVELACELASCYHWMRDCDKLHAISKVTIVQSKQILKGTDDKLRKKVVQKLATLGVDVIYERVNDVKKGSVILPNQTLEAGLVVWTAGVVPHAPTIDIELEKGHIPRTETLQLPSHDFAFAIGDVASHEKFAQRATREGTLAARNILRIMRKQAPVPFSYKSKGFLLSLGQKDGVGKTFGMLFSGFPAWFLWRTVYLFKFIGVRSKMRMASEYTIRLFKREA